MMNEITEKIGNLVGLLLGVIAIAWTGLVVIVFFITIFSSSTKDAGILYKWEAEAESKSEWKTFGDLEFHQKYVGEISDNEPDGDGVLYYSDGKKLVGFWREGELETWNENGKLYGRIYSYLIEFGNVEDMVWSIENDLDDYAMKYYEYEGEFKTLNKKKVKWDFLEDFVNRLSANFDQLIGSSDYLPKREPHGFGKSEIGSHIYKGYWENGKQHGQGIDTIEMEKLLGIKEVGEWKEGYSYNTITYDKDGSIIEECKLGLIVPKETGQSNYGVIKSKEKGKPDTVKSECGLDIIFLSLKDRELNKKN